MLRVPICRMSAYSATSGTSSGAITSVMIAMPKRSRTSASTSSPGSCRPWKL